MCGPPPKKKYVFRFLFSVRLGVREIKAGTRQKNKNLEKDRNEMDETRRNRREYI